jgi:hypothetical protein
MRLLKFLALILVVTAASACADDTTAPSTETPPAPSTEIFTGLLNPNGGITHPFSAAASGAVTATLSKVLVGDAQDTTIKIGLLLGTWNGTVCQSSAANDAAPQGTSIARTVSGAGRLCVRIYDAAGTLAEPVGYEVTVVHP